MQGAERPRLVVRELGVCHDAMVTAPRELVAILLGMAREAVAT